MIFGLSYPSLSVNAYDVSNSKMKITMVVTEAGLVSVDTKIDVNFDILSHGIYVFIPQDYKMTWFDDGKKVTKSYHFPVINLKVYNSPYLKSIENGNLNLRLGDPEVLIIGKKSYHFSYDIQLKDLGLDGTQLFYMNIVGTGWEFPINQVEYQITLPKGWPAEVYLYQGPQDSTETTDTYTINGNLLSGYAEDLQPYEGLTIYTRLSEDGSYFKFVSPFDASWLLILLCATVLLIMVKIFNKYGKDAPLIITPQFGPIEGFSSSQIGYVLDGTVTPKDMVSVIIEWAYKGYLRIIDNDDALDVTLEKIKDIPQEENEADKALFKDTFFDRDSVTIKTLQENIHLRLHQAASMIINQFENTKFARIFETKSLMIKLLLGLLAFSPYVIYLYYQLVRNGTLDGNTSAALFLITLLAALLLTLWIKLIERWFSYETNRILLLSILGIFTVLFYGLGIPLALNQVLDGQALIIVKLIVVQLITSVSMGFSLLMDRRSQWGLDTLGKILGLRDFIELAEKDRINALVQEDPSYFYKLLPYAYLFGVTEEWAEKFNTLTIEKPSWYVSNYDFSPTMFNRRLLNSLSQINLDKPMIDTSKQIGGALLRVGGAMISGGKGGGRSGGGFGGGGGGRW